VHYTEDVPSRAYINWQTRNIGLGTSAEIKDRPDFDKQQYLYDSMVKIGVDSILLQNKGMDAVTKQIKALSLEYIPSGEQLNSVINENLFTLKEWVQYIFETPDICLEKELQWPDEPDLIY
jgi:hypothetical protein